MARGKFDGDYLEYVGNPISGHPVSFSILFYPTNLSLTRRLISLEEAGGDQWWRFQKTGAYIQAYSRGAGGTPNAQSVAPVMVIDTWNHAAAVFAAVDDRRAFLNGGQKGTNASVSAVDAGQINRIYIGAADFEGYLAEAAIWDVALTDDEIAVLGLGQFVSPLMVRPESLVFYLPFIRDNDKDLIGGTAMTEFGTISPGTHPHPAIFYSIPKTLGIASAVAASPYGPRLQVI